MLICEFVTEVISSTAPVKLRIRHHDNSAISPNSAIARNSNDTERIIRLLIQLAMVITRLRTPYHSF